MRSKRSPDLDAVRAQFEAWRGGPRRRGVPVRLWRAAIGLLDRHSSSVICRHLGLNPSRFKRMRETFGRVRAAGPLRRCRALHASGRAGQGSWGNRRSVTGALRTGAASSRQAFVELAPLGLAVRRDSAPPVALDASRSGAECRLVVESAMGARLTVVLARADHALVEAVCRLVLGGPTLLGGAGT